MSSKVIDKEPHKTWRWLKGVNLDPQDGAVPDAGEAPAQPQRTKTRGTTSSTTWAITLIKTALNLRRSPLKISSDEDWRVMKCSADAKCEYNNLLYHVYCYTHSAMDVLKQKQFFVNTHYFVNANIKSSSNSKHAKSYAYKINTELEEI